MDNTNYLRIQKYLSGEMDAEELKLFESDLVIDPELAKDLKLQKEVNGFIKNYKDTNEFRKTLNEVHHGFMSKNSFQDDEKQLEQTHIPESKSRKLPRLYWSIAAVIIVILSIPIVMKLSENKKSNDTLFAAYYQAQEPINVRSLDTTQHNPLKDCMKEYSMKNYTSALSCFSKLQNSDKFSNLCIFFSGISYMETQDYKNAVSSFNKLINLNDTDFYEPSLWYSGLGYLKLNKTDSALLYFQKLNSTENLYKEQAEKIIEEIRN